MNLDPKDVLIFLWFSNICFFLQFCLFLFTYIFHKFKNCTLLQFCYLIRCGYYYLQLSEYVRESPYYNVQKIHFRPCLLWECEAIGLEVLLYGISFFNVQLGISGTKIIGLSEAMCGIPDLDQGTRVRFKFLFLLSY